ncbi:MAG: TonB family protein, partial [Steroidobacteraceae bacterium]
MFSRVALLVVAALLAMPARADLYSAYVAYEKRDFETAYRQYRELAELGQPVAQLNIAGMYARGEGVPQSMPLAYAWASIAAESGDERAQKLADQLRPVLTPGALQIAAELHEQFGRAALDARLMPTISREATARGPEACVPVNVVRPRYTKAAARGGMEGDVYAEYVVMPDGRVHQPRIVFAAPRGVFDESVRESVRQSTFKPAMADGKAVACSNGIFYRFTWDDLNVVDNAGLRKWEKEIRTKAENGDVRAQVTYGMMIAGAPRLNRSRSEALPWFLKAAQAGESFAQFQIGSSLMKGWGCEPDVNKGLFWLRKAGEADQPDAQVSLAGHALQGGLSDENLKRAKGLLERAAKQGHRDAKLYLAALLATAPSEGARDSKRALTLATEILGKVADDPAAVEIRAAASAAAGDFAAATTDQTKAIELAKKLGWDLAPQEERLARYR